MWKYGIIALAVLTLTACGGQTADDSGGDGAPTMPALTFSVVERDDDDNVVMEATVEIAADGSWQRTGTQTASGSLSDEQIARIGELVGAPDFPTDPENELICTTVIPSYNWSLKTGQDSVSNGNGGCVSSDSAVEIVGIIKEATDVGPTLEKRD